MSSDVIVVPDEEPSHGGLLYGGTFPGDPRFEAYVFMPTKEDVRALKKNQWLSTNLLDLILQRAGTRYDCFVDPFSPLLGSLGAEAYISSMNLTASLERKQVRTLGDWKRNQESIERLQRRLEFVTRQPASTSHESYRLVIPMVNPPDQIGHFFVGCFEFSIHCRDFFTHVSFYDSLERNATRVHRGSTAAKLVQKVNSFMKHFVLHQDVHHHLHQSDAAVLRTVMYESCPKQQNGYDCGIFAVAVCLHLSERRLVNTTVFEQNDATLARILLGKCFTGENMLLDIDNATSRHFRGCFPLLSGGQRLHYIGASTGSAVTVHYIGANNDSALSTQVEVKRHVKVKTEVKVVKRPAKVQRSGMTTRHNAKMKHDGDSDSHSDASSTKLKLRRILAKTAGRKSATKALTLTKVVTSSTKTIPKRKSLTRNEVDDDDDSDARKKDKRLRSIVSSSGTRYSSKAKTSPRKKSITRNEVMGRKDPDDSNDEDHEERDDEERDDDDVSDSSGKNPPNEVTTSSRAEDSTLTVASSDTVFYKVMADANLESFAELEHINPIVQLYEQRSGNSLRIKRSINGKYRVYQCVEHLNCPFEIRFSKRRSDGLFVITRMRSHHAGVRRAAVAADGRQWKKRWATANLDKAVLKVLKTKELPPTARDVMKTMSNKKRNSQVVPYIAAWRAIQCDTMASKALVLRSFQLVKPYLEELKRANPGSVLGMTRLETFELENIYFIPSFMNNSLKFVRPVISLDAAHLRSEFKGTLYIASTLTGANDVFPIGFMIATGNEDRRTWVRMLTYLKEACPIISEQGRQGEGVHDDSLPTTSASKRRATPFLFVSDRDKGLKEAVKEVFPTNVEFSCAQHIRANVLQRFGKNASKYVMTIAKTYSARYVEILMEKTKKMKPQAALYIQSIEERGILWKSSQWLNVDVTYPPRFGIVTSNTSESVNSMFAGARDLPWMGAFEHLVNLMSSRICRLRAKYAKRNDNEPVPRVMKLLKSRWEKAAAVSVLEVEENCGNFEVVSPEYGDPEDEENNNDVVVGVDVPRQQQTLHMVNPGMSMCTCGVWQDCMFPCRHGIAVYRLHKGSDLTYVVSELVHEYHKYAYVKETFKQNIYPVSMDSLTTDGTTRPPIVKKRTSGRPKTKRIRNRSEYEVGDDSPIICSNCGRRGHNKRTCPNPKTTRTECVPTEEGVPVTDLVQFTLCSHCGKEGHLEWQCLYNTPDEEMTLARNDKQDEHDDEEKESEEEEEEEHFMSAQASSVDNSSADEGAGEDEDGPDDFDEEDGDRF